MARFPIFWLSSSWREQRSRSSRYLSISNSTRATLRTKSRWEEEWTSRTWETSSQWKLKTHLGGSPFHYRWRGQMGLKCIPSFRIHVYQGHDGEMVALFSGFGPGWIVGDGNWMRFGKCSGVGFGFLVFPLKKRHDFLFCFYREDRKTPVMSERVFGSWDDWLARNYIYTMNLQLVIQQNQHMGKDSHIRLVKIFGPREYPVFLWFLLESWTPNLKTSVSTCRLVENAKCILNGGDRFQFSRPSTKGKSLLASESLPNCLGFNSTLR